MTKAFRVVNTSSSATNGCLCDVKYSPYSLRIKKVAASVIWLREGSELHIYNFFFFEYMLVQLVALLNLCSGQGWAEENWPVKTQANMTQLCTMAVRTNREMTQLRQKRRPRPGETSTVCLLWATEFSSSSATGQASRSPVTPAVGICVLDGLTHLWKSFLVRAISLSSVDVSSRTTFLACLRGAELCVREELVFPPVPSLFWCAFGCSLPDQIDQLLHANLLTLTDEVHSDLLTCFTKLDYTKCVISFLNFQSS